MEGLLRGGCIYGQALLQWWPEALPRRPAALCSKGIVPRKLSDRNALGTRLKDMGFEPSLKELGDALQVVDGYRLRV